MERVIILVAAILMNNFSVESCIVVERNATLSSTSHYWVHRAHNHQQCLDSCMADYKCDYVAWLPPSTFSYGGYCLRNHLKFGTFVIQTWISGSVFKCRGKCVHEGNTYNTGDVLYEDNCQRRCECKLDGLHCSHFTCPTSIIKTQCPINEKHIDYRLPLENSFKCFCPKSGCYRPDYKHVYVIAGNTAQIKCSSPTFSWKFNNSDIVSFSDDKYDRNLTTLFIRDSDESDEGKYVCESDSNVYRLVVLKRDSQTLYSNNSNRNQYSHLILLSSIIIFITLMLPNRIHNSQHGFETTGG